MKSKIPRGETIYATAEPLKGYPKKAVFNFKREEPENNQKFQAWKARVEQDNPEIIVSSWGRVYPRTFWGKFRYDYRSFYKETKRGRFLKKVLIAELIIGIIMIVSNAVFRESYHAKYIKRNLGK